MNSLKVNSQDVTWVNEELSPCSTYARYMESHLISFVKMENNIEKMDMYLKSECSWY